MKRKRSRTQISKIIKEVLDKPPLNKNEFTLWLSENNTLVFEAYRRMDVLQNILPPEEKKSLLAMIASQDHENVIVANEILKQKLIEHNRKNPIKPYKK